MKRDVEAATESELFEWLMEKQPNGYGTSRAWLAATEMGLRGDRGFVPALIEALAAKNHVAVCAARALAELEAAEAVSPLVGVLEDRERYWAPRRSAADALGKLGAVASDALPALRNALATTEADPHWNDRCVVSVREAILRIEADSSGRLEWCEPSGHACRHCDGVLLRLPRSAPRTAVLECSHCRRTFLQRTGEGVVDLAGPLPHALYAVIFSRDLSHDVESVAERFLRKASRRECRALIAAVDEELTRPTQRVSEIHRLKHRPSEEEVRQFLRSVADVLRREGATREP